MPGRPSQHCSLTATRTAFAPAQVAIAATMARVMVVCGVSKIPQPSSQAYSAPELLNPISRTAPRPTQSWHATAAARARKTRRGFYLWAVVLVVVVVIAGG